MFLLSLPFGHRYMKLVYILVLEPCFVFLFSWMHLYGAYNVDCGVWVVLAHCESSGLSSLLSSRDDVW